MGTGSRTAQRSEGAASRKVVLVCVLPAHGHVAPTAAVVTGLAAAGHRVRVVTGRRYADRFSGLGAEVVLLPLDADFDDTDLDASFPGRSRLRGIALARHDLRETFVRPVPARWRAVQQALAIEPPDVVLCDPLFLAGIPLLMTRPATRPPVYVLGFLPLMLPPLAPPGPWHGLRERVMAGLMDLVMRPVQREAEQIIRDVTGSPLPCKFMEWPQMSDGIFQMTCSGFEYPRPDSPVPIHFVGPVTDPAAASHPLPTWWGDLGQARRVVHVTQGTLANDDLGDLVLPTIRALSDEDLLLVVTTGGTPLPGPLPGNVRVADYLPYDQLLPRCDLMITNGGYGGVTLALRHGVPLLVAGATEDKQLVAHRVTWSGVGRGITRRRPTPRALRRAARALLADSRARGNAQYLAGQLAHAAGVRAILNVVETQGPDTNNAELAPTRDLGAPGSERAKFGASVVRPAHLGQ